MVYSAEKFGRPGLSPSSPFAVSESQTQHPHIRKTELTMIRKTGNSHNWTGFTVRKSRGRDREWSCRAGSTGKVPQTQEADAANLKALRMALSCSEAKTYSCYHTPSPSLLFPILPAGWTYAQRAILSQYTTAQPVPKNSESLSLSSSRHGHNSYQLCCQSASATNSSGDQLENQGRG